MSDQEQLEEQFERIGVDYSKPGFYNAPEYIAHEQSVGPSFIEEYAAYVVQRSYSDAYSEAARGLVPKIADYLYDWLVEDGRLGACVDASQAANKVFQAYGIWAAYFGGSLTIEYPGTNKPNNYYAHLTDPSNPVKAGHAWLVVPPFKVLDLTIGRQFNLSLRQHLDRYVLTEEIGSVRGVSIDDMVDQDVLNKMRKPWLPEPDIDQLMQQESWIAEFIRRFGLYSVELPGARLKYFPCSTGAVNEELSDLITHCFSGRKGPDLMADLAKEIGSPEDNPMPAPNEPS